MNDAIAVSGTSLRPRNFRLRISTSRMSWFTNLGDTPNITAHSGIDLQIFVASQRLAVICFSMPKLFRPHILRPKGDKSLLPQRFRALIRGGRQKNFVFLCNSTAVCRSAR